MRLLTIVAAAFAAIAASAAAEDNQAGAPLSPAGPWPTAG